MRLQPAGTCAAVLSVQIHDKLMPEERLTYCDASRKIPATQALHPEDAAGSAAQAGQVLLSKNINTSRGMPAWNASDGLRQGHLSLVLLEDRVLHRFGGRSPLGPDAFATAWVRPNKSMASAAERPCSRTNSAFTVLTSASTCIGHNTPLTCALGDSASIHFQLIQTNIRNLGMHHSCGANILKYEK